MFTSKSSTGSRYCDITSTETSFRELARTEIDPRSYFSRDALRKVSFRSVVETIALAHANSLGVTDCPPCFRSEQTRGPNTYSLVPGWCCSTRCTDAGYRECLHGVAHDAVNDRGTVQEVFDRNEERGKRLEMRKALLGPVVKVGHCARCANP